MMPIRYSYSLALVLAGAALGFLLHGAEGALRGAVVPLVFLAGSIFDAWARRRRRRHRPRR